MIHFWNSLRAVRRARGLSNTATIVVAAILVFVFWGIFKALVGAMVGLLALAIQIAVMILVFVVLVYAIKAMTKKV